MSTIYHLSQYAVRELKDTYTENEIKYICNLIFVDVLQYTNIDIHLRKNEVLDESFVNKFYEIVRLLKKDIPLQYIIGSTEFAGLTFRLNSSTLIPRPETEELVMWIKNILSPGKTVLDIGTGSGCIAIALAASTPGIRTCATDISPEAIEQAQKNASLNHADVDFCIADILHHEQYTWENYDIIVSNPPYIRNSEKALMHPRVLDNEPHRALFVPDSDPLIFYRTIATFGQKRLNPHGHLFFEINEALGEMTCHLLEELGYTDIILKKDIHERDRFIKATSGNPE